MMERRNIALELHWSDGAGEAACEHGHLCAWIEQLRFDGRFAWMIDTPDHDELSQVRNLAGGIEVEMESAKQAVYEAAIRLGAAKGGSWKSVGDCVIQMFPARRREPATVCSKSPLASTHGEQP